MSLLETYQSRKTLFANKLTSKGVTANNTEGLTTLINKIDNITGSCDGVLVYTDKDIVTTGDNVKLGAIALDGGKLIDTPITIEKEIYSNSFTGNVNNFVPSSEPNGEYTICETTQDGLVLQKMEAYLSSVLFDFSKYKYIISFKAKVLDNESTICSFSIGSSSYFFENSKFVTIRTSDLPQGVNPDQNGFYNVRIEFCIDRLQVYVEDNAMIEYDSEDFTDCDDLYFWFYTDDWCNIFKDFSVIQIFGEGSHGITNGIYYGKGNGNKEFIAKCGNVQSEPYPVLDAIFRDGGTTSDPTVTWWTVTGGTLTRTPDYSDIVETSGSTCYCRFGGSDYSIGATNGVCEFDMMQVDGSNQAIIYIRDNTGYNNSGVSLTKNELNANTGEWIHVKLTIKDNKVYYLSDKMQSESSKNITTTYTAYKLMFACNNDVTNIRFKNVAVY